VRHTVARYRTLHAPHGQGGEGRRAWQACRTLGRIGTGATLATPPLIGAAIAAASDQRCLMWALIAVSGVVLVGTVAHRLPVLHQLPARSTATTEAAWVRPPRPGRAGVFGFTRRTPRTSPCVSASRPRVGRARSLGCSSMPTPSVRPTSRERFTTDRHILMAVFVTQDHDSKARYQRGFRRTPMAGVPRPRRPLLPRRHHGPAAGGAAGRWPPSYPGLAAEPSPRPTGASGSCSNPGTGLVSAKAASPSYALVAFFQPRRRRFANS
jgi:hypothetical protein